jgi:hypothetical protein
MVEQWPRNMTRQIKRAVTQNGKEGLTNTCGVHRCSVGSEACKACSNRVKEERYPDGAVIIVCEIEEEIHGET